MKKIGKICPRCKSQNYKLWAMNSPEAKISDILLYKPDLFECNNCGYTGVFPSLVKNKSKKQKK